MTLQEATWFQITAQANFSQQLLGARGKPDVKCLQIGAYKGDASRWLLRHVLTGENSSLDDVDPWGENEEYRELDPLYVTGTTEEEYDQDRENFWFDVKTAYLDNIANYEHKVDQWQMTSNDFFQIDWERQWDFIYIDGAHDAISTLEDGVNAYKFLRVNGLLAFDDYTWAIDDDPTHAPALAIDSMRLIYRDRLVPIVINSQFWFRKVA